MKSDAVEALLRYVVLCGIGVTFGVWQHSYVAGILATLLCLWWTNLTFRSEK